MKTDISIECAKAYTSDKDDAAMLEALQKLTKQLGSDGKTFSLVLLVDDVTYPDKTFEFDTYAAWLGTNGYEKATIFRESQITSACDEVLGMINFSLLDPSTAESLKSAAYTAPLFVASWCLLRLGLLEHPVFVRELQAERLINILSSSFKLDDDGSLEIIRATPYAQAAERIDDRFIPDLP